MSACGFALMAIFAKQAYRDGLNVSTLLATRFGLAAAIFWAIVWVRRAARPAGLRAAAAPPARSVVLAALALGAIGYSFQAGLFFNALTTSTRR